MDSSLSECPLDVFDIVPITLSNLGHSLVFATSGGLLRKAKEIFWMTHTQNGTIES